MEMGSGILTQETASLEKALSESDKGTPIILLMQQGAEPTQIVLNLDHKI